MQDFTTPRQRARAKEARCFLHLVACPLTSDLKKIITTNFIADCPVTHDDVDIAEDIYGHDRASKRGKITQTRPNVVVQDYIEVPKELVEKHENITLYLDTMFVNKMPFMVTISKNIKYQTADYGSW